MENTCFHTLSFIFNTSVLKKEVCPYCTDRTHALLMLILKKYVNPLSHSHFLSLHLPATRGHLFCPLPFAPPPSAPSGTRSPGPWIRLSPSAPCSSSPAVCAPQTAFPARSSSSAGTAWQPSYSAPSSSFSSPSVL